MAALLLAVAPQALAQRQSTEAEMNRLIDQLRPGATRGIRVPGEPPPPSQPAQGLERGAGPTARPAPRTAPPTTTAQPGVPAASVTVLFATGSATVTDAAARSLEPLGRALTSQELAPFRFRIEGHTDTVGSEQLNQQLSDARAQAVRDFLVQRYGVQPNRLEAVGLGQSQLLVPTGPQVPERRNRRVQIINIGS